MFVNQEYFVKAFGQSELAEELIPGLFNDGTGFFVRINLSGQNHKQSFRSLCQMFIEKDVRIFFFQTSLVGFPVKGANIPGYFCGMFNKK
jgi:hypothetical protein